MPFLHLAFVALVTFLPAILILRSLPDSIRRDLVDGMTALPVGFALSYLLISTIQLATTLIGYTPAVSNSILYLILIAVLGAGAWLRRGGEEVPSHPVPLGFPLFALYLLALVLLLPSYKTAFSLDWFLYYPNTFAYLGRMPLAGFADGRGLEYLIKRTPEMSLFGSFFVSLLGHSYDRFQVACLLPNAGIWWVIYLFSVRLFGPRAAVFSLSILALAPAMLRVCTIPEPKIIATFFVLLSAYYYLLVRDGGPEAPSSSRGALAGVLAVGAFMCHPSMLFYSLWIAIDQAYLRWRKRPVSIRPFWMGVGAAAAVLAVPWYAWLVASFGWRLVFQPTSTLVKALPLSAYGYCVTRLKMMITTLVAPSFLAKKLWNESGLLALLSADPGEAIRKWGNLFLRFYDQTYIGGMTLAVGLTVLLLGWRLRPRGSMPAGGTALYVWMSLGAVTCFLVHLKIVDNQGHATNLSAPLFVLVLCYAGAILSRLPPGAATLVLAISGVEMVLDRVLIFLVTRDLDTKDLDYVYASTRRWFTGPGLLVPVLFAAAVAIAGIMACRRPGLGPVPGTAPSDR